MFGIRSLWKPFLLGFGLTGGLERAAAEVLSGRRGQEKELWSWMMSSAGAQRGMLFLEKVMKERTVVLGYVSAQGRDGQDQATGV